MLSDVQHTYRIVGVPYCHITCVGVEVIQAFRKESSGIIGSFLNISRIFSANLAISWHCKRCNRVVTYLDLVVLGKVGLKDRYVRAIPELLRHQLICRGLVPDNADHLVARVGRDLLQELELVTPLCTTTGGGTGQG